MCVMIITTTELLLKINNAELYSRITQFQKNVKRQKTYLQIILGHISFYKSALSVFKVVC